MLFTNIILTGKKYAKPFLSSPVYNFKIFTSMLNNVLRTVFVSGNALKFTAFKKISYQIN